MKAENERIFLLDKIASLERENLMRESYSKRLNILVHELEETNGDENKEQTRTIFERFFNDALEIEPGSIDIVDLRSLPSKAKPKVVGKSKNTRPIIVKVMTAFDKDKIYENVKKLKQYNDESNSTVYITDHLPKIFYKQKRSLSQKFKEARKTNRYDGALMMVSIAYT